MSADFILKTCRECSAHLVLLEKKKEISPHIIHLNKERIVLGRSPASNVVLKSTFSNMISRTHAIIDKIQMPNEVEGEEDKISWKITDKSQNGILVNNIVIEVCILNDKDSVTFGGKGLFGVGAEVKKPLSDLVYSYIENPLWDPSLSPLHSNKMKRKEMEGAQISTSNKKRKSLLKEIVEANVEQQSPKTPIQIAKMSAKARIDSLYNRFDHNNEIENNYSNRPKEKNDDNNVTDYIIFDNLNNNNCKSPTVNINNLCNNIEENEKFKKEKDKIIENDKRNQDSNLNSDKKFVNENIIKREEELLQREKELNEREEILRQKEFEIQQKFELEKNLTKSLLEEQVLCKELEEKYLKAEELLQTKLKDEVMFEEEFTCCICQDLFICAYTIQCSHSFCECCILDWMKLKKQCPVCRSPILKDPIPSRCLDTIASRIASRDPIRCKSFQERQKLKEHREIDLAHQLEDLINKAREKGERFLSINEVWKEEERQIFSSRITSYQGKSRALYCYSTGLTEDYAMKANLPTLKKIATNIELPMPYGIPDQRLSELLRLEIVQYINKRFC